MDNNEIHEFLNVNHTSSSSQHIMGSTQSSIKSSSHNIPTTLSQSHETTHSSPPNTALMLHVLNPAQLEVIFPCDSSQFSNHAQTDNSISRMQTRLQSRAITRKDYTSYIANLPQLSTLKINTDDHYQIEGFSFVAQITDLAEPTTFRSTTATSNAG